MGNYASVSDIQNEFKSITFTASSAVSSAAVAEIITQEELLLDAEVGTVYVVPVSSSFSSALSVMKAMTTLMVKARVIDITSVKNGSKEEQGNGSNELRERVRGMLDRILNKTMLLNSATLAESSSGVKSYNVTNSISHKFTKESDQW